MADLPLLAPDVDRLRESCALRSKHDSALKYKFNKALRLLLEKTKP